MKEFFIDVSDDLLTDMRLIVEGAVNVFEGDASPLNRLARDNDMMTAYRALSTIGSALYDLRKYICEFEEAHTREAKRQLEA